MEKRQLILGITAITLLILLTAGCYRQEMVCNPPYIRFENSCCLDQNNNKICDDDDTGMFEPTYAGLPMTEVEHKDNVLDDTYYEELEKARETTKTDTTAAVQEASYEETEEETEEAVQEEPKPKYTSPKVIVQPKPYNWYAANENMEMEVTRVSIRTVNITPKDKISPDKDVYLKDVVLRIKNNRYYFLHMKLSFRLYDGKDSIISEILECDPSDDIKMDGCKIALREGEEMNITLRIDEKMPRIYENKTMYIILEEKTEIKSYNSLEIRKSFDLLNLSGAVYS